MCKSVLIVDKDIEMKEQLAGELVEEGYNVVTAQHLGEVLEKALTSCASLVVVNLQSLDISGWETISMIKKLNKSMTIITITEDNSIEMERKIREEGVFFHFVKPFAIEDIKAVIKSAINTAK